LKTGKYIVLDPKEGVSLGASAVVGGVGKSNIYVRYRDGGYSDAVEKLQEGYDIYVTAATSSTNPPALAFKGKDGKCCYLLLPADTSV
jgi:hypothetical protein